jgi:hypothetical protein
MKRERKFDIIFILVIASLLIILHETGNSSIIDNRFALVLVILTYFIGKGVGKGSKEREWREKTDEDSKTEQ